MLRCNRSFRVSILLLSFIATLPAAAETVWPPEVAPALASYRSGDFAAASEACALWMQHGRTEEVRQAASVIRAICLLRSPARESVITGRSLLQDLATEAPQWLNAPEVRLAAGLGALTLNETSTALGHLQLAADSLAEADLHDRLALALVAQARVWAIHNEWTTTPGLRGAVPESPAEAAALREEKIRGLRERALTETARYGDTAAARIDLIMAELLLSDEERAAAGVALLKELSAKPAESPEAAAAALRLAEWYEQHGDAASAVALYDAVAAAEMGELSARAGEARAALRAPVLQLDVPGDTLPGEPVPLGLRTRNIAQVRVEVRRLDVGQWLKETQAIISAAQLPVAGSLVLEEQFAPPTEPPLATWDLADAPNAPTLTPEAGAYVVWAEAESIDGRVLSEKRLLIATRLQAAVFVGQERGLVWALPRDGEDSFMGEVTAEFWMRGSYVPTQLDLANGVAAFALPGEARVYRDTRWVCLVRAGDELALCQGRLPRREDATVPTHVRLATSPTEPPPGGTLRVVGQAGSPGQPTAELVGQSLSIDVRDALDNALPTTTATIGPAGIFTAEIPLNDAVPGRVYNLTLRSGRAAVPNLTGRTAFRVKDTGETPLQLLVATDQAPDPNGEALSARIAAGYPWGVPLGEATVDTFVRRLDLPGHGENVAPEFLPPLSLSMKLGAVGGDLIVPIKRLELEGAPYALSIGVTATGWDGRTVSEERPLIWQGTAPYGWIRHLPGELRAAAPAAFQVRWFDPREAAWLEQPVLEITRDGKTEALPLYAAPDGFVTAPWSPPNAGEYALRAVLRDREGATHPIEARVTVAPSTYDPNAPSGVVVQPSIEGHGDSAELRVALHGQCPWPVIALARDAEPRAAVVVGPLSGTATARMPADLSDAGRVTVSVLAMTPRGLLALGQGPAERRAPEVRVRAAEQVQPGGTAPVKVTCVSAGGRPAGGTVVLRVVSATSAGRVNWLGGTPGGIGEDRANTLRYAISQAPASEAYGAMLPPLAIIDEAGYAAWFARATQWVAAAALDETGTAEFSAPLPESPGTYRLLVTWIGDGGETAAASALTTVAPAVASTIDLPTVLHVGDACRAAVTVTNTGAQALSGEVSFAASGGITTALDKDGPVALTLAPGETRHIGVAITAQGAGEAVLTARLEFAGHTWDEEATCAVLDVPAPASEEPVVVINRTIQLLEYEEMLLDPAAEPGDPAAPRRREWTRYELPAGYAVTAPVLLLIRDEVTVSQPIEDLEWQQTLPPTVVSAVRAPLDLNERGRLTHPGLQRVERTIPRLSAGTHIVETCVAAVRPGHGLVPPPTVRTEAGEPVPARVLPETTEIRVDAPAPGPTRP